MIDARDVLLDDRTFIQLGGHVVRGRADELDAAIVRLLVGPSRPENWAGTNGEC